MKTFAIGFVLFAFALCSCNPKESVPPHHRSPPRDQSHDINRQTRETWNRNNAGELLNQPPQYQQGPAAA